MGSLTVFLAVLAVFMMASYASAAGSCPLPSKVYGCSPKCVQDHDCKNGKLCCPNGCNTKSCTDTSQYPGSGGGNDKYSQSGGTGVYCGNVKCSPFEVCKQDPSTKRMKCGRA